MISVGLQLASNGLNGAIYTVRKPLCASREIRDIEADEQTYVANPHTFLRNNIERETYVESAT